MRYQIYNYLQRADRPIYSQELERSFNLSGEKIRDHIRELRREGVPIVGSPKGYFIAKNREELEELISNLEGRATSMFKTVSMLKKNRERAEYQQMSLF